MNDTPKGLRTHIGIVGRRNAGKSSLLNALAGMDCAIVSDTPGTTTDPVEKTMEMAGIGPVVLVDTAGMDDSGALGRQRVERTRNILRRMDMAILLADGDKWEDPEDELARELAESGIPWLVARNKLDKRPHPEDAEVWRKRIGLDENIPIADISAEDRKGLSYLATQLRKLAGAADGNALVHDLIPQNGVAVLVAPQDSGAPRGRLILPQAQTIRDLLDNGRMALVMTENQYPDGLSALGRDPDIVICDSQIVKYVDQHTPSRIPLTTFSILMARHKGDLNAFAAGAGALRQLKPGDAVIVQEACSHQPQPDDIGRTRIPALLRKIAGGNLEITFACGKEMEDYPERTKAIIHCGACVITGAQMRARQKLAEDGGIPMTNYGMAISLAQGILPRVLAIFPDALARLSE